MPLNTKVRKIKLEHHIDAALDLVGGSIDDLLLELIAYGGRKSPSTHGDSVLVAARVLDRTRKGESSSVSNSGQQAIPEEKREEKEHARTLKKRGHRSTTRVPSVPSTRRSTRVENVPQARFKQSQQAATTESPSSVSNVEAMLYRPLAAASSQVRPFHRPVACLTQTYSNDQQPQVQPGMGEKISKKNRSWSSLRRPVAPATLGVRRTVAKGARKIVGGREDEKTKDVGKDQSEERKLLKGDAFEAATVDTILPSLSAVSSQSPALSQVLLACKTIMCIIDETQLSHTATELAQKLFGAATCR